MKNRIIIYGILAYSISTMLLLNSTSSIPKYFKYDMIIVLGNSPNRNNKPNSFLKRRLMTGIELLNQGYSDKILLSGSKKESNLSEAEIMKRYCIINGVSPTKIIVEDLAESTKGNLVNSKSIMDNLNLKKGLVVTSGHHVNRTIKYCQLLNLNKFEVIGCKNNLITSFFYLPLWVRELFKTSQINEANI